MAKGRGRPTRTSKEAEDDPLAFLTQTLEHSIANPNIHR